MRWIISSIVVLEESPWTNLQVLVLGPKVLENFQGLCILQTVRYVWSCYVHKFCYRHRAWGYGEECLTYWYMTASKPFFTVTQCREESRCPYPWGPISSPCPWTSSPCLLSLKSLSLDLEPYILDSNTDYQVHYRILQCLFVFAYCQKTPGNNEWTNPLSYTVNVMASSDRYNFQKIIESVH